MALFAVSSGASITQRLRSPALSCVPACGADRGPGSASSRGRMRQVPVQSCQTHQRQAEHRCSECVKAQRTVGPLVDGCPRGLRPPFLRPAGTAPSRFHCPREGIDDPSRAPGMLIRAEHFLRPRRGVSSRRRKAAATRQRKVGFFVVADRGDNETR